MADKTASDGERDIELEELKAEIAKLKAALAERAQEFKDAASERATRAAEAIRTQAQAVSGAVRDNPRTAISALVVGGIIALLVVKAMNHSEPPPRRWYDRY